MVDDGTAIGHAYPDHVVDDLFAVPGRRLTPAVNCRTARLSLDCHEILAFQVPITPEAAMIEGNGFPYRVERDARDWRVTNAALLLFARRPALRDQCAIRAGVVKGNLFGQAVNRYSADSSRALFHFPVRNRLVFWHEAQVTSSLTSVSFGGPCSHGLRQAGTSL